MLPLWFWLQVRVLPSALLGSKSTCISWHIPEIYEKCQLCVGEASDFSALGQLLAALHNFYILGKVLTSYKIRTKKKKEK